jgi:hypothetical protein
MIEYEPPHSSFLVANRNYCEKIVRQMQSLDADCNGYCNGFGYEFESTFSRTNLTYNIKFIKYQTTQRIGDAHEYGGIEMLVSDINPRVNFRIGKSLIRRLFSPRNIRSLLPKPYYIEIEDANNTDFAHILASIVLRNKISLLQLKNGTLSIKIHMPNDNISGLVYDIENLISQIP